MADDLFERNDDQVITGTDFAAIYGNLQKSNAMLNKAKSLYQEPGATNITSDNMERGGALWRGSVTYAIGDVVIYNDFMYIATTSNINLQPDTHLTDWRLFQEGIPIPPAIPERGGIVWEASTVYVLGDVIAYNSELYIALTSSTNIVPSSDVLKWKLIDTSINYIPDATGFIGYELASYGQSELDIGWSPLRMTPNTLSVSTSLPVGVSATIVSPTIADGVTITVPDGSTLIIL